MTYQLIDIYNSPEFNILYQRCDETEDIVWFVETLRLFFDFDQYTMDEYEDLFWIKESITRKPAFLVVQRNPLYLPILRQEGKTRITKYDTCFWKLTPQEEFTQK